MEQFPLVLRQAWRQVARCWPRRLLLRDSGERVELLHIEENGLGSRCLVERKDGTRRHVLPAELVSEPLLPDTTASLGVALALAIAVASISIAQTQAKSRQLLPEAPLCVVPS